MKTISFYSYKGGVGRSLALAYTARYMARHGKKVCILDTDLEAPGIIYKFPEASEFAFTKLGTVDYINSFVNPKKTKAPDNLEEYFSLVPQEDESQYGYIKIMSAGKGIDTGTYWSKLAKINMNLKEFFLSADDEDRPEGKEISRKGLFIFENLKNQIEKQINPDYLLIDSRSGVTMLSILCNSVLPDHVVMFLANNDENFYGSARIYNHIRFYEERKINKVGKVICVITRYPTFEDVSDIKEKRSMYDLAGEFHIKKKFMGIVNNTKLKEDDISIVHSDRDIERNELSIIKNVQHAKRRIIGHDYEELIEKIIGKELLKEIKYIFKEKQKFAIKIPKYAFIEFGIHKMIEDELKEMCGEVTYEEFRHNVKCHMEKKSTASDLFYKLALCERYDGNIVESIKNLSVVIENAKKNDIYEVRALYLRGLMFLYDFHNYNDSLKDLEMILKMESCFTQHVHYHLAACCYCLAKCDREKTDCGKHCKNIEYCEKAIKYIECYLSEINSTSDNLASRAYLLRAVIYGDKRPHEKDNIISDYEMSIRLDSHFAGLYNCRGVFYKDSGEIEKAIDDFNEAIRINSKYYIAYSNRGSLFASLGETQKAFDDYSRVIEINSGFDLVYKRRGDLFFDLGKTKEALADYNRAIEINPDYRSAYKNRERIFYYERLEINLQRDDYFYYDSENNVVEYEFPVKYHITDEPFKFASRKNNDKKFLSDQGKTLKMLSKCFLLSEYEVTKNLVAILRKFRILKNGADFSVEIHSSAERDNKVLEEAKYRLFCCVSFMNKMHIFYETNDDFFDIKKNDFLIFDSANDDSQCIIETYAFPIRYYKPDDIIEYEFVLIEKDGKYFISDQGRTLKMLDEVFELSEPDVQKNLKSIMKVCRVLKKENKNDFLVEINSSENSAEKEEAKHRLLECVSFMDTMRIFYV